jgi:hypothetical protein
MRERTRRDYINLMRGSRPRTRKTVTRVIEGKVDQDGATFIQEQLSFVEPDLTVRQVDFISSRTCSFGHLTDQQVRLVGKCERCESITCSTPGCSFTCSRCGKALCRRHAHVYGQVDGNSRNPPEAYCSSCRLPVLLRRIVLGRRR